MISREDAIAILKKHLKNKNLLKHCYSVEAGMRHMANFFGENEEKWGIAGLLHDIDYAYTANTPEKHGVVAKEIFEKENIELPDDVIATIQAHTGNFPRKTLMDNVLYATDPLTGFIVAAALLHPKKSIFALDTNFLLRRFKEKSFARGANREIIKSCETFMPLEEFMQNILIAMQNINEILKL